MRVFIMQSAIRQWCPHFLYTSWSYLKMNHNQLASFGVCMYMCLYKVSDGSN